MIRALLIVCLLLPLFACGGGGSGSASAETPAPEPDQPTDPAPEPEPEPSAAFSCGSAGASQRGDLATNYVLFESGPVRPLALSPDGSRLLVTNTPANCLEIYDLSAAGLSLVGSVMVGLEPVAVAFADDNEAWVVNHLSDSISIVRLDGVPRVQQTLQVGDEPRDIVFAGPEGNRAFITAAYRGQNHPGFRPDDLTRAGLGRADVWIYDRSQIDGSLNGNPLVIVNLFADSPRALAVAPEGQTVYAAAFMSGNGTTTLAQDVVAGAKPAPVTNVDGVMQPDTGLIVRKAGTRWLDESGRDWSPELKFDLPDLDVFAIDASAQIPKVITSQSGVGTVLFTRPVVSSMSATSRH